MHFVVIEYCDHAPSIHKNIEYLGVAVDIAPDKNDSNVAGPSDPKLQSEPKSCIVDSATEPQLKLLRMKI